MKEFIGNVLDSAETVLEAGFGSGTKIGNVGEPTVGKINKLRAVDDVVEEYKENLEETKSHVDSVLMTGVKKVTEHVVGNACLTGSLAAGTYVSTVGGFTPPSLVAGFVTSVSSYVMCSETTKNMGDVAKNTVRHASNQVRKLPDFARGIIKKCISPSVDKSISTSTNIGTGTGTGTNIGTSTSTGTNIGTSAQSIDKVKDVMSDVIFNNWEKIEENGAIIYCEDIDKKQIQLEIGNYTVKKIVDYCNKLSEQNNSNIHMFENASVCKSTNTMYTNMYNTNMNLDNMVRKYNFEYTNTDVFTKYNEPIPRIHEPNYGLLERVNIGRMGSSIPDYTVTCTVTETKSRGAIGIIGSALCIMVKIAIVI